MLTNLLDNQSLSAKKLLEQHKLIQTSCKSFLNKNLKDVQVLEILEMKKINGNFVSLVNASDEYFITELNLNEKILNEEINSQKIIKKCVPLYFLTISSLRIKGIPLHWYFMKMKDHVYSMERNTLRSIFIEKDTFIFSELECFFRKVVFERVFCKGDVSKELGKRLILSKRKSKKKKKRSKEMNEKVNEKMNSEKNEKMNKEMSKEMSKEKSNEMNKNKNKNTNKVKIKNLLIFDRTVDLLTPTNTKINSQINEKQMLNILLTKTNKYDKLNTLLNHYLLMVHLKRDLNLIKREMVYTFGEKVIVLFDCIDGMVREEQVYVPDLCRAVWNGDEQFYDFDLIEEVGGIEGGKVEEGIELEGTKQEGTKQNTIKKDTTKQHTTKQHTTKQHTAKQHTTKKDQDDNVVLILGGVSQKEIKDLKNFTILTTKIITDDFLTELQE